MNTKKKLVSVWVGAIAAVVALYPGALAFADSGYGGVNVGANIQATVKTDEHGSAPLGATTSADMNESDSQGMDSEQARGGATSTMYRSSDEQGDNNEDNGNQIEVGHDVALQATTTIENSDQVHNRGQLRSFLNHLVKADDRVADVQVSSTSVETQYSLPARFLWAIPTSISAQVSIGTNGAVTITYPWYAFLFAKHDGGLEAQLTQAASSTGVTASTTLSASMQAHLLDRILSILKGD